MHVSPDSWVDQVVAASPAPIFPSLGAVDLASLELNLNPDVNRHRDNVYRQQQNVPTQFRCHHNDWSTRLGDRPFAVAGPRVWNCLPAALQAVEYYERFRKLLKTHLFDWAAAPSDFLLLGAVNKLTLLGHPQRQFQVDLCFTADVFFIYLFLALCGIISLSSLDRSPWNFAKWRAIGRASKVSLKIGVSLEKIMWGSQNSKFCVKFSVLGWITLGPVGIISPNLSTWRTARQGWKPGYKFFGGLHP